MKFKNGIVEGLVYLLAGILLVYLSYYIPALTVLLLLFAVP